MLLLFDAYHRSWRLYTGYVFSICRQLSAIGLASKVFLAGGSEAARCRSDSAVRPLAVDGAAA